MKTPDKQKPGESGRSRIYFRRYTSITSALDVLSKQELTLLSPENWDDENDRECMAAYKKQRKKETILALCLTEAVETYHHWKIFTSGEDGACIYFHKDQLIDHMNGKVDFRFDQVNYLTPAAAKHGVSTAALPFTKLSAYSAEREWRLTYESTQKGRAKGLSIPRSAIFKISLNPWMPPELVKTIRDVVQKISEFNDLKVDSSKVKKHEEWLRGVLKR